jgi:hypothetical protein
VDDKHCVSNASNPDHEYDTAGHAKQANEDQQAANQQNQTENSLKRLSAQQNGSGGIIMATR